LLLFFGFFLGVCFVLFFRDRFFAELQALRRCLRPTANRRAPGCRRWKPLQYWYRKTIYTDVMVACGDAGQDDTSQVCYVNNDSPFPFTGTVQIDAVDFATGTATSVASKKCVWVRHRFGPFLAPLSSALQPPPPRRRTMTHPYLAQPSAHAHWVHIGVCIGGAFPMM